MAFRYSIGVDNAEFSEDVKGNQGAGESPAGRFSFPVVDPAVAGEPRWRSPNPVRMCSCRRAAATAASGGIDVPVNNAVRWT
ncbi:MAG TPA: hypothetical protein VGL33_20745 [Streptosporangiaceae bacterium]|jgi:hypothetical protein